MAYYDIQPHFGNGKNHQGRVVGYKVMLVLSFGAAKCKYFSADYLGVIEEYKYLKDLHPYIKSNPNPKKCIVCGHPLMIHILCNKHQRFNYSKGRLITYKPIKG